MVGIYFAFETMIFAIELMPHTFVPQDGIKTDEVIEYLVKYLAIYVREIHLKGCSGKLSLYLQLPNH